MHTITVTEDIKLIANTVRW